MLVHEYSQPTVPFRVVVMGAGGFVGSAIVRHLAAAGIPTLPLSRRHVDLMDPQAAQALAAYLQPDDVFVAVSAIAPVKTPRILRDNITMMEAIAAAFKIRPVAHVVNIGSDAVFADSDRPLTEESCRAPGSLHGIMHLAREVMFGDAVGGGPLATLRPSLIYGLDDPHNGYGPNRFRRLAAASETITLFGEGEERRDHVWVEDVAALAVRMVLHRSRGSLNAATGTVISFREVAESIVELSGSGSKIESSSRIGPMPHGGYRPFDVSATYAAFPDFKYTLPLDGFKKVQEAQAEKE